MSDTQRQRSYLVSALGDNVSKSINAQVLRDELASMEIRNNTTQTANYPATTDDQVIFLSGVSNTVAVTLPDATTCINQKYFLKCINITYACSIATTSSQTIDGSTTYSFSGVNDSVLVVSDGANWRIIGKGKTIQAADIANGVITPTQCATAAPVAVTPGQVSGAGSAATLPKSDHTHQASGGIAAISSEQANGGSKNDEETIVTGTMKAGTLAVGTTLRFNVMGSIQYASTSGALTFRMYLGNTAASQTIVMPTQTTGAGPFPFYLEGYITVQATGAGTSGKYVASGTFQVQTSATAVLQAATANSTQTNLDTTIDETIKLTAQWTTSSASNILKSEVAVIEVVKM